MNFKSLPRNRKIAFFAGLVLLLVLILAYLALKHTGTLEIILDATALHAMIDRLGIWGPVAVVFLMMLAVLVSPIPSAPIAMVAGAAYGHTWGTLYIVAGAEAGALAAFGIARLVGQDVVYRWLGERASGALIGSQNALTGIVFLSRLLPFVSFDLLSYAAGLTPLSLWRFALATLAGVIPVSFALAHFGREMSSGEADRFLYTALGLGLLTGIPLAIKLWRDAGRRGN